MRQIAGALTVLIWMVALSAVRADDLRATDLDHPAPQRPASFTPEQRELANEFLEALGWEMWMTLEEFGVVADFADPEEAVNAEMELEASLDEFRGMLKPELMFLRKACELSEPEFQPISQSAEARLREVTRRFIEEQQSDSDEQTEPNAEPRSLPQRIQDVVAQVAECQLSVEQWQRYSDEFRKRSQHRKRVAILNLVARLDHDLRLSPSQRDQFAKLFEENWNAVWGESLGLLTNDANFMPMLPEEAVARILSPAQRAAMTELPYDQNTGPWGDGPVDWFFMIEGVVLPDTEEAAEAGLSPDASVQESEPRHVED